MIASARRTSHGGLLTKVLVHVTRSAVRRPLCKITCPAPVVKSSSAVKNPQTTRHHGDSESGVAYEEVVDEDRYVVRVQHFESVLRRSGYRG